MKYLAGNHFHSRDIFPEQRGGKLRRTFLHTLIPLLACAITLLVLPAAADTPQDLLAEGHVDQAMRVLEQDIHSSPTAEAYNLLCRADFELDDWDAGIPACEKAVSLAPDNGLYHLWLGRIYGEKADRSGFLKAAGLAKKVHSEFERAVEFDPNSWEAHTDLAEFYLEAPGIVGGGEDKARAQADLLASMNPAMADWVRARIAQKKKDNAVAEKEYRAAIDASHGGARAWVNLAGFYRHTGRLDEMEQALRTMESRPLDWPAALMDGASLLLRTRAAIIPWRSAWCAVILPPARWRNGPLSRRTISSASYSRNKVSATPQLNNIARPWLWPILSRPPRKGYSA